MVRYIWYILLLLLFLLNRPSYSQEIGLLPSGSPCYSQLLPLILSLLLPLLLLLFLLERPHSWLGISLLPSPSSPGVNHHLVATVQLYCSPLYTVHCTVLYCTQLYCTIPCCKMLYSTSLDNNG